MFRLTALSLAIVLMASNAFADATATGTGGAIPDGDPVVGISSTATVSGSKTVENVSVTVSGLTHTWLGDLNFTLTSPAGTTVDLVNRPHADATTAFGASTDLEGGDYTFEDGGDDIWLAAVAPPVGTAGPTAALVLPAGTYGASTNNFDGSGLGSAAPAVSLAAAFAGEEASGDWVLTAFDNAAQDTGDFLGWTVNITSVVPEPAGLGLIGFGFLALLARRRR